MEKTDRRLVGLLGTVIIHLIIGIMIMAFKIRELHVKANLVLDLELATELENRRMNDEELKLPELSATTAIERALQGDAELLNIARNLASTAEPAISREEYIDMVKDELLRSGQLGEDNYIDRQRLGSANSSNENYVPVNTTAAVRVEERKPSEQNITAANYKGPTRISYFLEGRTDTYIDTPIYKCQGSGIITLRIEVNPSGRVEKATVLTSQSVTDQCLSETAINSAYASRFNSDVNAPKIQTGTLTFEFVAQ